MQAVFSPDSRFVATTSQDRTARVWDAATGAPLIPPLKHDKGLRQVEFSPDGRRLLTVSEDNVVGLWNVQMGKPLLSPLRPVGKVHRVCFSPSDPWLLVVANDMTQMWEVEPAEPRRVAVDIAYLYDSGAFSPGGRWLTTTKEPGQPAENGKPTREDGEARVWDSQTGRAVTPPLKQRGKIVQIAFSRDAQQVLTGTEMNSGKPRPQETEFRVWSATTGQPLSPAWKVSGTVVLSLFSPDGRRLLFSCDRTSRNPDGSPRDPAGETHVWDARTGAPVGRLTKHGGPVARAVFSPDSRYVATAGPDAEVRVWNAATGDPVTPPLRHPERVSHISFSPDGRLVVTAGSDRMVRFWEADTGKSVNRPLSHTGPVLQASFSPDGRSVVTVSARSPSLAVWEGEARVWRVDTRLPLTPPLRLPGSVVWAAFSPDGRQVATGCRDRSVQVWDAATGEALSPILRRKEQRPGHSIHLVDARQEDWPDDKTGREVAFSPDGRHLLTSQSGFREEIGIWDLLPDERPVADLQLLSQLLAGHRIDTASGSVPLDGETFRSGWETLRSNYPRDFSPSADHTQSWHRRQAEECEEAEQWFAAAWHFDRLQAEDGPRGQLPARRGRAHAEVGSWERAAAELSRALDLGAEDPRVRHYRARAYLNLGRYEQALSDFSQGLAAPGADWTWWLGRHFVHARLNHLNEAEGDFAKAVERSGTLVAPPAAGARPEEPADAEVKAAADYSRALARGDGRWWVWRCRGLAYAGSNRWDQAAPDFARAAELKPDDWQTWRFLARAHVVLGNEDKAVAACAKALELKKDGWVPWYLRGVCRARQKQPDQAAADFSRAIELDAPGANVWQARGDVYAGLGQWEKAAYDFRKVCEINPTRPEAWMQRANAHAQMRKFDSAIADLTEALRLNPRLGAAHVQRGDAHFAKGDYSKAIADWSRLLDNPNAAGWLYRNRGIAYLRSGQFGKAIVDFTKALQIDPVDAQSHRFRAVSYHLKGGPENALPDLDEAIRLDPKTADHHFGRGHVRAQLGRWEGAAEDFARAIDLGDPNPATWHFLAHARLAQGDRPGFRRACTGLVGRFGKTSVAKELEWVVVTCILVPQGLEDTDQLIPLASKAVAADPTDRMKLMRLGAALYRAGRLERAVERLTEALDASGPVEDPDTRNRAAAYARLFLAMAHHRLNHPAEAKRSLDEAVRWIDQADREKLPLIWYIRRTLLVLRQEAESLLKQSPQQPKKANGP
jgi:WD40 repeat protein/tetratricopeptide (TPR) repeat protein